MNISDKTPDEDSAMAMAVLLKIKSQTMGPTLTNSAKSSSTLKKLAVSSPESKSTSKEFVSPSDMRSTSQRGENKCCEEEDFLSSCEEPLTTVKGSELGRIRQEEVNAALRSKPQRGRKRDNLSALERLELTRTRNREHAKSTRSVLCTNPCIFSSKFVSYKILQNAQEGTL